MPPPLLAVDAVRPTEAEINDRIRTLMDLPASAARTEEYVGLLTMWAKATAPPADRALGAGAARAAPTVGGGLGPRSAR